MQSAEIDRFYLGEGSPESVGETTSIEPIVKEEKFRNSLGRVRRARALDRQGRRRRRRLHRHGHRSR
mgnify:CR=1 FL=1